MNKILNVTIGCLGLLVFSPLNAQNQNGFFWGPFEVSPTVSASVFEDDNVLQTETDEKSDTVTTLAPAVSVVFDNGISGLSLNYSAQSYNYRQDFRKDYTEQTVSTTFGWAASNSHRLEFGGSWQDSQDNPIDTNNLSADGADEFEDTGYFARYILGASDAPLTLSVTASNNEREYTTNQADTQFNNFDTDSVSARVTWRFSPDLDFFVSGTQSQIDYVIDNNDGSTPQATSDSDSTSYNIGFNWDVTTTTRFNVSVGQSKRDFENDDRDSTTNGQWNTSISWAPLSYSRFTVSASRSQDESATDDAGLVDNKAYNVSWAHNWSDRFATNLSASENRSTNATADENDTLSRYRLSVTYAFSRWLDFSLFAQTEEQESNTSPYESDQYGMTVSLRP